MRWRRFFQRRRRDEELALELHSYLEHEADEQRARQRLAPEAAREAARRKLGNTTLIREEVYRMNSLQLADILWQDFRYALRVLRKSPGFLATAVLSLALGIGVNTAMFSVIDAVLLQPLPYAQPEQLVRVAQAITMGDVSMPEVEFCRERQRSFSAVSAYRGGGERRLNWSSSQEWISTVLVSSDFLRTLAVAPAQGREFSAEETLQAGPQAIILTDGLWRRSFGADAQVVGRVVRINEENFTVVGVLPPSFWFPLDADALLPLRTSGTITDTGTNTQMIARLKDGVTVAQAQADLSSLTDAYGQAHGIRVARNYRGLSAVPLRDWLVRNVRVNLLLLFGSTALLLLIACANLASLLLTRFAERSKELAVRLALGSSRGRLFGQFVWENSLLVLMGTAAGIFAAYGLLKAFLAWMPLSLPTSGPVQLNVSVLLFTGAVAAGTAVVFSLLPLLTSRRLNVHDSLKSGGRSVGGSAVRVRTRNLLVVGEIALSATLLIAAGLLIQSLYRLHLEQIGFRPQGLITFETPFSPERRRNLAERDNFTRALAERLSAIPGARRVAAANLLPLTSWNNFPTQRDGHPEQTIGGMEIRVVTPAYFELMGIPVRAGRTFTGDDRELSRPVVVVNETLARRWWAQENPTGDSLTIGRFQGKPILEDPSREVIGVVGDTKTLLTDTAWPTVFIPLTQSKELPPGSLAWIVQADRAGNLAAQVRAAVAEIDSTQRIRQLRTMDTIVASSTAQPRFNAWLFACFAGVALALAALGVYGLLSFIVNQRRQEIGARMALGATSTDVLKLFFKQGVKLATVGLLVGVGGALVLSRWLASLLYGVQERDVYTFVGASIVLLMVALAATYVPARRATKIDPIVALRYE